MDGFARQVEQALEHFAEPEWLGAHSRLAAPFVFGQIIGAGNPGERASERGVALQEALRQASEQLGADLRTFIADLYFQRNRHFTNVARAMKHSMSERTFYRRRNQAIQALSASLYEALLPPLRAERPPVRPLVGRAMVLQASRDALRAGQSVYLSGPSGIGKTVLAACIAGQWPHACFWFTLRAQLTDRLASFVFALAFYLRSQGASATWRQLIADNGLLQVDRTLSLLRYDLAHFATTPLLICVDDLDALAAERADQAQLLHLLDELRNQARLLLTGQRVVLETDAHFALTGFDDQELADWLALGAIREIGAEQRARLRQATRGHPALLGLLATLHAYGEDLLAAAATIPDVPSLEVLLARVWRRLDEAERHVLMGVAVYRTAAPQDDWRDAAAVMDRLLARGLLVSDGQGGVECDSHLRRLIYERIAPEVRRVLHLRAAVALEERGEFVRALYHYLEAHQAAQAVWLWFSHRKQQVERGQGPAALALLDQIAPGDLPHTADQAAWSLSRAELLKLVGRADGVQEALRGLYLDRSGPTAAYAQQILADALEKQGEIERSLATYRAALETLTGTTPLRQVVIYQKLSYLHTTRLPNLGAAQQEAWQAIFYAETSAANVDELQGDLTSARERYRRALEVAARMEHGAELLAVGYSHLGKCLLKLGDLEAAVETIQQALALSEMQGDLLGPLYDRINLAYALMVQGRTADAWTMAAGGLAVAERMQHGYLIAGLAAAAADAACRQGENEAAERLARHSLFQEEEFFRPWALTVLGGAQAGRGAAVAAQATLQMAVEAARLQEDLYGEAYALEAMGKVCWQSGQVDTAQLWLTQAYRLYGENGFEFEATRLRTEMAGLGF